MLVSIIRFLSISLIHVSVNQLSSYQSALSVSASMISFPIKQFYLYQCL